MTKEQFFKFLNKYNNFYEGISKIEEMFGNVSLWECDWVNSVGSMYDIFLDTHFNENGCDLINAYMLEDWRGSIYNDSGEEIKDIQTLDDLWSYLINYREDYFNE